MKKEPEIILQFSGKEFTTKDLLEQATKAYKEENGNKAVKDIKLYVKPEEDKAYYVVNDTETGSIAI